MKIYQPSNSHRIFVSEDSDGGVPVINSLVEQNIGIDDHSAELPNLKTAKLKRFNKRKMLRQSGMSYITPQGKEIPKKEFVYIHCKCKLQCEALPSEVRHSIHKSFWAQGNWQTQTSFIVNNVNRVEVKRRTTGTKESRRKYNNEYFLKGKKVCLKTFSSTLGVAQKRVDYAVRMKQVDGLCNQDLRGLYDRKENNVSLQQVNNFLDSLPHYKSHYSHSNSLYFSPELNKTTAYELYAKNSESPCVSKKKFMSILKAYKVKFHSSRSDTCRHCNEIKANLNRSTGEDHKNLQRELSHHHGEAQAARESLTEMTLLSKMEDDLLVFTFDLEKTQPLPHITTSVAFYKRQLWLYNLGINTRKDNQGHMHVWLESEGRRGANEICSSLFKFLKNQNFDTIKRLHSFSHYCGGQNRNAIFVQFMSWFCNSFPVIEWQHSYLEPCHTFLPNDSDFAMIEKKKKQCGNIYTFNEWVKLIESCTKKNPFTVIPMRGHFKIFDSIFCRPFPTVDDNGEKFVWDNLKWIKAVKGKPTLKFGTDHQSKTEKSVTLSTSPPLNEVVPEASSSVAISKEKYLDLLSLLPYVPAVHANFYLELPHKPQ